MKILYLTDQIYLHGGIEKVLSQKANYLADVFGYEVVIVTHNQQNRKPVYHFSPKINMIDLGINYETGVSYFSPVHLRKIPVHIKKLKTILKELNPDVVINSSFGPDFYFLPFLEKRIPKIKELHATRHFQQFHLGTKAKVMKNLIDRILSYFNSIVLLNEDETAYYPQKNIIIIPNPTERDERTCELSQKKIIAAGRVSYQKNFEDLIAVASELKKNGFDWEIHIYGEDYLGKKEQLQILIDLKDLGDYIKFKGVSSDLKETFLDYSIYAMTSNHETFPMVLLEALSLGLPIISYDCYTGPSRIISDGSDGFLVPFGNVQVFVERLEQLMVDDELRKAFGKAAKMNAERFEISVIMEQWKKLFNTLVDS